ncbi:MAG: flagellar export chaperone FlgN [Phycisphaerae bacterium]
MTTVSETIAPLLDDLIALLDEQGQLVARRIEKLDELTDCITGRDEKRLEALVEKIDTVTRQQEAADRRLAELRSSLAASLGTQPDQTRLGDLIRHIDGPQRKQLTERRQTLLEMVDSLRDRHMQSVMLIAESSRINRLLLSSLFGENQEVNTYNTTGSDNWRDGAGLVDTEL